MIQIISAPQLHQSIAQWVDARIPGDHLHGFPDNVSATGFVSDGKPFAGVVYYDYCKWNIMAAIAVEKPHGLPRRALRAIFDYPFVQLDCLRITALIASKNKASIDFCERLGFRLEGVMEDATPTDSHLIYGLLKRNCIWHTRPAQALEAMKEAA